MIQVSPRWMREAATLADPATARGAKMLWMHVMRQAIADAKTDQPGARLWLYSVDAVTVADLAGFDTEAFDVFVDRLCEREWAA